MRSGGLLAFTGVLTIIVLAPAGSVSAAPLELKQVAADSKWVAHVDVDAIRGSQVVRNAWHAAMEKHKDVEPKLALVRGVLGMDPTKDVHGITFYGKEIGKPQGVMIVSGDWNSERLAPLAGLLPNREDTTYGDYKIASWKSECNGHACPASATLRGKEQLVVAGRVEDLKSALDVLDGKAAGLSAEAKLAGNIPPGTAFLLRVEGVKDADIPCQVPVLKQIESLRLVVGENAGQSFVRKRVTFTDAATAALALDVVEGRKAEMSLLCPDELGRKFMAAVQPKQEGSTLTLLWSASADDVWQEAQKIEQFIEKHRAKHKEHDGKSGCPFCQIGAGMGGKCPLCGSAGGKEAGGSPGSPKKGVSPEEDF
jgi:hypothetical protein